MKTRYRYIHFVKIRDLPKTCVWSCRNNRSGIIVGGVQTRATELGIVRWYGPWRQYCYFPRNELAVYSQGCLKDICSFLAKLAEERKQRAAFVLPKGAEE